MRKDGRSAFLALVAAILAAACSKSPSTRFSAEAPDGWKTEETRGVDSAMTYRLGSEEISATLYGRPGSFYPQPKDLVSSLAGAGTVIQPDGDVTVAGQRLQLFRSLRSDPSSSSGVFEESWIFLPVSDGFWALRYRRPAIPKGQPRPPDDAWRRFVTSFQPSLPGH